MSLKLKMLSVLLLVSSLLKASPIGEAILGTVFIGTPIVVGYCHYWYDDFDSENGLYVSPGLDPKMLSEGLKLDIRQKVFYKYNRLNPYLVWETFGWATYESYSGGLDYCVIDKKLSLLVGFETGIIHNQNKHVWSYGGNVEMRLHTNNNYSVSIIYNPDSSPDLLSKKRRHNVYMHLNIKLNGK